MTVGDRIRKRRIELGYSQDELAKKMGYHGKSTICKAETCGDNINTAKVRKYAEYLECSYDFLMGWEDEDETYTDEDLDMLDKYKKLNEGNKKTVINYIDFLLLNQKAEGN